MPDTRTLANALTKATTVQYGVTRLAEANEATAGEAVDSTDPRLADSRPPNGSAGGVLAGSYPNPTFAEAMATDAEVTAAVGAVTSALDAHIATVAADAVSGHVTLDQVRAAVGDTGLGDYLEMPVQITPPATPASGLVRIYQGLDHTQFVDETGAVLSYAHEGDDIDSAQIVTGTIAPARLGSGTPDGTTVLLGNSTWGAPPAAAPGAHAASHASGGGDPVTPAAIGAASTTDLSTHAAILAAGPATDGHMTGADKAKLDGYPDVSGVALLGRATLQVWTGQQQFNEWVGIGQEPTSPLHAVYAPTGNFATKIIVRIKGSNSIVSNSANYMQGLQSDVGDGIIPSGVTDTGYRVGFVSQAYTNNASNQGTLTSQYGAWLRAGHNATGAGSVVTNVRGVFAEVLNSSANGTITTAAAVWARNVGTTGVITNRYDFYGESAAAMNYFAGSLGLGVLVPTEKLDVSGKVKATAFVGDTRLFGGWLAETAPSIGDHYGSITLYIPVNITLSSPALVGYAVTPPSGSAATMDVEYKRGAGAWTSIYSVLPTIAAGANTVTPGTLSTTQLNAGDFVRLNFDAVNSAAGITLSLLGTAR